MVGDKCLKIGFENAEHLCSQASITLRWHKAFASSSIQVSLADIHTHCLTNPGTFLGADWRRSCGAAADNTSFCSET